MVCLSDAANIQATVRDKCGLPPKKPYTMELYRDKKVDNVFNEIAHEFRYDVNSFDLVMFNVASSQPVFLNEFKGKTLEEAGLSFTESRVVMLITRASCKEMDFTEEFQGDPSPAPAKFSPYVDYKAATCCESAGSSPKVGNCYRDPQTSFSAIEAANQRIPELVDGANPPETPTRYNPCNESNSSPSPEVRDSHRDPQTSFPAMEAADESIPEFAGANRYPSSTKYSLYPEPEAAGYYEPNSSPSPKVGNSSRDPQTSFPAIEAANHRIPKSPPVCNYVGLVNQAMTCYLNSLLQALYMTPEFRNALYNWEFDGTNPGNSIPFQLQRLFLNLQTSPKSAVETTDLTHSFGWNMQQAWEQHDIQELCRVMFDALEQRFKDTKQANLINDLYEGKMFDYVKCLECSTEKSREDTFQDIPLPVRPYGSAVAYNSVEEALRAFVQPETLEGNNQYHCEKCNKKCDAHKGLKFTKFPYLLTLHLKRFDFDYSTMNRIKLNDKVVFPEVLNLNSFIPGPNTNVDEPMEERETVVKCDDCSTTDSGSALDDESCQGNDVSSTVNGPEDNCQDDDEGIDVSSGNNHHENEKNRLQEPKGPYIYELFSIMIHSGSASGGHYYAYIKDFSKNQWFCFNDQTVSPVTEDDINKTYGGGPQRGYYSGAYTSSTNAYMLMYRQIDKERNCQALTVEEFPEHIKKLLKDMREKEEADRIRKEQETEEIETYKIKVYCQCPIKNITLQHRVLVFFDTTLAETTAEVYEKFKLKDEVNLEDCRLVAYNKTMECIEHSFESNDLQFGEVTKKCTEFLLQIKKPNAVFEDYKVGGVEMKVFVINLETEEVENPTTIWVNPSETVGELKRRLCKIHNLDTIHIVQETYSNPLRYYFADNEPVRFDPKCHGYKLYVSRLYDLEDPDKHFDNSKLASVIDRFVHIVSIEVTLPDTDIGTLEQLSIPSLDLNQNLDRIEVGAGDGAKTSNPSSLRVSPQLGPVSCEIFSDQSNSEDSSLSDSDRTLVGDAPGDNIGLLSSSSNSPADQHMASPTDANDEDFRENYLYQKYYDRLDVQDMMAQDGDAVSPLHVDYVAPTSIIDYYFKASPIDSHSCRVLVDKRISLRTFKKNLQSAVGVPMDYFKIYRLYPNQDMEWSTLTDTLGSLKDGERLNVKLGRVLKSNEMSGKIYFLDPNGADPITFWFEWIIAEEQTVASVKKEILLQAKKQYFVDIPFSKCRLRKKTINNPSNIYLDEERFTENIVISRNFEMFVQEISGPEKTDSSQMVLFVRLWKPSKLELGPFQEVRLEERTMDCFKKAVSALSNIPLEFLEVASVKNSFPADMHVLEIHTNLDWNPDKYFIENFSFEVYDDGCILFYRDSRESLKILTMDERKELLHSENKRLGRFCKKNYSPRRERGLKIYVDTSPKIEDEVFLD